MKTTFLAIASGVAGLGLVAAYASDDKSKDYDAKIEAKFQKADANGDGSITESEFLDKARADFAEMAGADGSLTLQEVKDHHAKMKDKTKSDA